MSWNDKDIDKLFQDNATNTSFEYKNAYWEEFEVNLPVNKPRGGDLLWMATAVVFLGIIATMSVLNQNGLTTSFNGTTLFSASNPVMIESLQFDDQAQLLTQVDGTEQLTNDALTDENLSTSTNRSNNLSLGDGLIAGITPSTPAGTIVAGVDPVIKIEPIAIVVDPKALPTDLSNGTMGSEEDDNVNALALRAIRFEDDRTLLAGLPAIPVVPIEKRAATLFYLEMNGGLSESIVSPSDQYSNSFGAGLGIEVQKGNFNFTGGVNAIISNHNDIQLNRNAVIYGYGSEVVSTHLNYSQVYSLEANLSIGYSLGKHLVTIGVRPSYVVGSKVRDRRIIENNLIYDIQGYGYMDGLRRFGLKPQIGYAYKFKHGFTAGANIGIQTRKSLNEDFINGENNTFPIDGQVYLRKTLFGNNKKIRR